MSKKSITRQALEALAKTRPPVGKERWLPELNLRLTQMDRSEAKAELVKQVREAKQFLRPLPSHEERLKRLRDWHYLRSSEYERYVHKVDDVRNARPGTALVEFERAFRRKARENHIPLHCHTMEGDRVVMIHSQWWSWLSLGECQIIAALGLDTAHQIGATVAWSGHLLPSRDLYSWEVTPYRWEREHLPYPTREPTRDEINASIDEVIEKVGEFEAGRRSGPRFE